jgi:hypothetical protein
MSTAARTIDRDDDLLVGEWRAVQLQRLGLPWWLSSSFADIVDRPEVARLVRGGCPSELALRIVRWTTARATV